MTVGQLGAKHLGKWVEVGANTGPGALLLDHIAHAPGRTVLTDGTARPTYPPDTPCTVVKF